MNYLLPEPLRNARLAYYEARENPEPRWNSAMGIVLGIQPNEEAQLAAQLRDLKPLREVERG